MMHHMLYVLKEPWLLVYYDSETLTCRVQCYQQATESKVTLQAASHSAE